MMMPNLTGLPGVGLQPGDALHAPPSWLQAQETFHWAGVIVALLVFVYAGGLAYLFLMRFLAPGVTGRSAMIVREKPFRSLLFGLMALAVMAVLAKATTRAQVLGVATIPLAVLLFFGGVSAISQELGTRAFSLAGRSGSTMGRIAAGWGIAFLGSAVPVLGWVVGGLILLPLGVGGFVLAFFTRSGEPKSEPAVVPIPNPLAAPEGGAV
jgi:hypothetical protein